MAIPESEIERVKSNVKLVAVIRARVVELKRKGKQLWGLCPFHAEDEPSFAVDEKRGLWNCLGKCQTGGDVFSFVMKSDVNNKRIKHAFFFSQKTFILLINRIINLRRLNTSLR